MGCLQPSRWDLRQGGARPTHYNDPPVLQQWLDAVQSSPVFRIRSENLLGFGILVTSRIIQLSPIVAEFRSSRLMPHIVDNN